MEIKSKKELLEMYDLVSDFSEGLAVAIKDNKQFHIHPDGRPAYSQKYDTAGKFVGGLAWVCDGGKWCQIRSNGTKMP